ncbi:hypothetical protein ACJRO7_032116 [Eucalyptus globulus]|uniref:CBS domain-containing protein n=1 Tax=Eucalyptus globulus TaxID=34317 RepID=A0ABD3JM95_EUCGL
MGTFFLSAEGQRTVDIRNLAPLYLAINVTYGSEVSKELTPLWILGPLLVALYVKLFRGLWALYLFTFKQTVKVVKNLPVYYLIAYQYVANGKLKEDVRSHVWQPVVDVKNLDYKELSRRKLKELQEWLLECSMVLPDVSTNNFSQVIDHTRNGETLVIGLMLRSHLLVLLHSKVDFQHSPLPCEGSGIIRDNFNEFVKPATSRGLSIDDIHLSSDDLEMYIDLAPFLNPSPYVVPEDMSLTKVYNLFRQLGLRHIFVVPRASHVIGLITRKDLLIEEENEDLDTVELQSTSVRGRRPDRRVNGTADMEDPLLNDLLVQNRTPS